jgi:hypothetical protein
VTGNTEIEGVWAADNGIRFSVAMIEMKHYAQSGRKTYLKEK